MRKVACPLFPPLGKIVILDAGGKIIKEFNIPTTDENDEVRKITKINWIDLNRIGVRGQINLSVNIYSIIDIPSGQVINDLYGQQFVWSPDKKILAIRGWYTYLTSETYEQSDYLEINENPFQRSLKKFIEIAEGENAIYPTPPERDQEILQKKYHRFRSNISWSSDGSQVGVLDEFGDEAIRNLFLGIVNVQAETLKKIPLQSPVNGVNKIF